MLVQSWLQVPYTEHSSKSARREQGEKTVILVERVCPETPPADWRKRLQFRTCKSTARQTQKSRGLQRWLSG